MRNKNLKENKFKRFIAVTLRGSIKLVSKKKYIELQYKYITHHKLHFNNPVRYTEKLQYLRYYVYPKMPLVSKCAERVGVRDFLIENNLEEYLIPVIGIYDKFDDIDFDKLPNQFAMKCSHGCAMNYICFDKTKINKQELRKKFNKYLKTNYGKKTVELHYSPIKPQIIIEQLMLQDGHLPDEYKIHCFNGKAKNLYLVTGRGNDIRYTNMYIDWTPFDGSQFNGWKKLDYMPEKPGNFSEMIKISELLSAKFPFVRVDLYNINGKIYFSEMTFTPAKGTLILDDDQCDFEMGKWLNIKNYLN
ncbi:MAG: hypothetical protein MJ225_00840 [Bacilli bacterium]|nr:hypothetical protein [Bacilli bacterium]